MHSLEVFLYRWVQELPKFHLPLSLRTLFTPFQIKTYHAHLQSPEAGKVQLWFKHKSNYYCPQEYSILDNNLLEAKFSIPFALQDSFKPASFDIVINNDLDGTFAFA
jgi:hypothetical protein